MPPSSNRSLEGMFNQQPIVFILVGIALIGAAFWFGNTTGYDAGYEQAQADVKALQDEAANKAAADAAKSANPFQAVNPLEGVEANPFEKVKKVLNPFEQ